MIIITLGNEGVLRGDFYFLANNKDKLHICDLHGYTEYEKGKGGIVMKKFVFTLIVLVVVIGGGMLLLRDAHIFKGNILVTSQQGEVITSEFENEYLRIRFAMAEGKYVMKLELIADDLIQVYSYGSNNKFSLSEPGFLFDEIARDQIEQRRVHIYKRKGFFYKRPIFSLRIGEINDVQEFETIQEAREFLK